MNPHPQSLRIQIRLSTCIFSAFNGDMTVIFLTMMLTYKLMKSPWPCLLIRVFPISDQIKHNRGYKLKRGPICSKGQSTVGDSGMCCPENFQIVSCQRCNFMHIGGQNVTENEVFMIIKLDVGSHPGVVSPF